MEDTDCPDNESIQRLLTHQVNCVLPKLCQMTNCWPVLAAAFLQAQEKRMNASIFKEKSGISLLKQLHNMTICTTRWLCSLCLIL